jgi:hypothetical protein
VLHLLAEADPQLPSLAQLVKWIPSLGGGAVLVIFSYLWLKGLIVRGADLEKAEKRAATWENAALRSLGNNERLTATNERVARVVEEVVKPPTRGD